MLRLLKRLLSPNAGRPRIAVPQVVLEVPRHERLFFFGHDQHRGYFFRLAHVTSNRFIKAIEKDGLRRADSQLIFRDLFIESGLPLEREAEIRDLIRRQYFGHWIDSDEPVPVFFYPVSPLYGGAVRSLGAPYGEGGEFYRICKDAIISNLRDGEENRFPAVDGTARVVIFRFYLGENVERFFGEEIPAALNEDLQNFINNGNNEYSSLQEFSSHIDVPPGDREATLELDTYITML